ncbi:MAG: LLM class flavin-dependent oxidoreductase [Acidobacteriota bacterium]|nr:LLM class flavin-dependent oxidoreductase [Acidobacteriota bacterium]
MLKFSLLDFQHPGAAVALACSADNWGYERFWLGEHHFVSQCANPLLLGALLAGTTHRIRIGSGGVSLTYTSPYRLAEDARLIEFMLPGRFDLGVTRGLTTPGWAEQALLDGRAVVHDSYYERFELLHGLVTGRLPQAHPLEGQEFYLESGPPIWTLGLSPESAAFAGRHGTGFCYSLHHAPPGQNGRAVVDEYRRQFSPSPEFPEPFVIVVIRCICAATGAEAQELAAIAAPSPASLLPTVVGAAPDCLEELTALARGLGAQEVMLIDFLQSRQEARLEMYNLIAQAASLPSGRADAL